MISSDRMNTPWVTVRSTGNAHSFRPIKVAAQNNLRHDWILKPPYRCLLYRTLLNFMDYETLDNIADAYIPALAGIYLIYAVYSATKLNWIYVRMLVSIFGLGLFVAYGFMLIDNRLKLAANFGMDYSTHTAVALVMVSVLSIGIRKATSLWIASFIGYLILMLYQKYHTLTDIIVTGLLVGVVYWGTLFVAHKIISKKDITVNSALNNRHSN